MNEFPPVPSKETVLKQALAWLSARKDAPCVGQAHLLIQRLVVTLQVPE